MKIYLSDSCRIYFFLGLLTAQALFAYQAHAQTSDRLGLDTTYHQESGTVAPGVAYVWYYNESWSSSLQLAMSDLQETGSVEGFSASRLATVYDERSVRSNLLSARFGSMVKPTFGATVEYKKLDRLEFGYFQLPQSLSGDWVSFENNSKITALFPGIRGGLEFIGANVDSFTYFDFAPTFYLSVDQSTQFKPIIAESGKNKSTGYQDPGYFLVQEIYLKADSVWDVFILGEASVYSFSYDIKELQTDGNKFFFSNGKVSMEFRDYSISANFVFKKIDFLTTVKPYIGIGYAWSEVRDKEAGAETRSESVEYTFGLKYRGDYLAPNL